MALMALEHAAAEGSFQMLSKKEMGLDENGKYLGFKKNK